MIINTILFYKSFKFFYKSLKFIFNFFLKNKYMTYPVPIINLFIKHTLNNIKVSKISEYLDISIPTLNKWYLKYKENIDNQTFLPENTNLKTTRSTNKIIKYTDKVVNFVSNNIFLTLKDVKTNLNQELSVPVISKILKINGISRKRCNKRAICKDFNKVLEQREEFKKTVNEKDFFNSVFIDECSFCINDYCNYGYSKKGKEIYKVSKHKETQKRITFLASMSNEQVRYTLIEGSVNSKLYLDFIKQNNNNFKNKNIVQDNARIHHAKIVKEYCKEQELNMVYNPPYTPEYNPIELLFNKLKADYRNIEVHDENISEDIKKCLENVTKDNFNKFINHSFQIIKSSA